MAAALLILVLVVWQIGNEAERIKGEVEKIEAEATTVVEQIEHEADRLCQWSRRLGLTKSGL
jgi:hypothetical protein